ncbi:MAG: 23S rRNA (adenine(2503)-C(2))-methyltransferase RlmN [Candidatus Margulisbacteria bacterium]|nr:23S rRNA (adenine(2503)-C(2))-methyltransferase RlmN [Candidatus Margulisiibacteriota bacterium]
MPEKDLKSLLPEELQKLAALNGEKSFCGTVLFEWMHQKYISDLNAAANLAKKFRAALRGAGYYIGCLTLLKRAAAADGALKYLFVLADGCKIETVLLEDAGRRTLCLSTQVGCRRACLFCATGRMGFRRDLSAGEIADQVLQVEKRERLKINNLVYMGMGEPLDNYENTLKSVRILNDKRGRNIGARHITISTCGIIPGIARLAAENLQIRLAVSLHGATDAVRGRLMPVNKKYPVAELIRAVRAYQKRTGRRVTFEYIMIDGLNDTREHARGLLKLLSGLSAQINLIEYNPHSRAEFTPSPKKTIKEFWWIITDRGFAASIRYKRGGSINAGCGQLYAGR